MMETLFLSMKQVKAFYMRKKGKSLLIYLGFKKFFYKPCLCGI